MSTHLHLHWHKINICIKKNIHNDCGYADCLLAYTFTVFSIWNIILSTLNLHLMIKFHMIKRIPSPSVAGETISKSIRDSLMNKVDNDHITSSFFAKFDLLS